jgi:Arc/MetJ-type ribon-helix-helix transcriptional regulator
MTILLTKEQEMLVQKQLADGKFGSEAEVISEALTLLERKSSMNSMKEALKSNHERNRDLSADEAMSLANKAVKHARQQQ